MVGQVAQNRRSVVQVEPSRLRPGVQRTPWQADSTTTADQLESGGAPMEGGLKKCESCLAQMVLEELQTSTL